MSSFLDSLAKAMGDFGAQLGSSKIGALTQIWVPEPADDGGVILNTHGLPFSLNGAADLLSLFRCISCKYKFSTDTTKPWLMGPVGRVYTTGEPEMTHNVQEYDSTVYIRHAEAIRCQVNNCMFLPVYTSPQRDSVAAVMEVIQTESSGVFAALIDWANVCLRSSGLWTIDAPTGTDALPIGLRSIKPTFTASAFESKVDEERKAAVTVGNVNSGMLPQPSRSFPMQHPHVGDVEAVTETQPMPHNRTISNTTATTTATTHSHKVIQLQSNIQCGTEHQLNGTQIQIDDQQRQQHDVLPPVSAKLRNARIAGKSSQSDKEITLDDISPHFNLSLREAALQLGMALTTLKRVCRRLGLQRWPRRDLEKKAKENASASHRSKVGQKATTSVRSINTGLPNLQSGETISAGSSGDHALNAVTIARKRSGGSDGGVGVGGGQHYDLVHLGGVDYGTHVSPDVAHLDAATSGLLNRMVSYHQPHGTALPTFDNAAAACMNALDGATLPSEKNISFEGPGGMESLDILAAADFENISVGNSPTTHRGLDGSLDFIPSSLH